MMFLRILAGLCLAWDDLLSRLTNVTEALRVVVQCSTQGSVASVRSTPEGLGSWPGAFDGVPVFAAAILDRLLHHCDNRAYAFRGATIALAP
jgi:hypothetical protein